MAHSVHESPVSAFCTSWVIEYAILKTYEDINVDTRKIQEQRALVEKWEKRCEIQLEQIGICLLRDVYRLKPSDRVDEPSKYNCPFHISQHHGCNDLLYITDNCLIMCDDVFYDPCKCDEGQTCYESVFEKATCDNARIFDIRSYVNDPEAQLTSLHWPDSISPQESQDEATNQRLNDLLADVTHLMPKHCLQVYKNLCNIRWITWTFPREILHMIFAMICWITGQKMHSTRSGIILRARACAMIQ